MHLPGDPAGDLFFAAAAAHLRGTPEVGGALSFCQRLSELNSPFWNGIFIQKAFLLQAVRARPCRVRIHERDRRLREGPRGPAGPCGPTEGF